MMEFVHPDDREKFQSRMREGLATKEQFEFKFRVRRSNNETRYVRVLNEVVRNRGGKAVTLLGTLQDVTERYQAESELRRAYEEVRQLADHLQSARENERVAIAREIHDEMAQSLTAQKIDLVRLKARLPEDDSFLTGLAADILASINQTIDSVQRILMNLRPALLDDLGLLAAIEWQVEQFQARTDMACRLVLPEEEPELTQKERTAMFRIMQEALLNILRHSGATAMCLELRTGTSWLLMKISDNGKGVSELEVSNSRSFGLIGMRERAHVFGGKVIIKGEEGKGTTVSTRIPLKKHQNGKH
jgi:signal transduction histidine kinase